MIRRMALRAATIAISLALAGASHAHPDVSVASRLLFDISNSQLQGLATLMVFDAGTSQRLAKRADTDGDGQLSKQEVDELRQVVLQRLKWTSGFTEIRRMEQAMALPNASFSQLDYADGYIRLTLAYRFTDPVDLRGEGIDILMRDRDLALAFRFDPQLPVLLRGDVSACAATVADRTQDAYFGGLVVPQVVTLSCR